MEKNSLNNLEINSVNLDINEDIIISLKTDIYKRDRFKYNSNVVTVPNFFYRFIGIKNSEKEYYENLYRLDKELKKGGTSYIRFSEGLVKDISIRLQNILNDIWVKVFSMDVLDVSLNINLISDNGFFPKLENKVMLQQIKNNLKGLIEYYIKSNELINNDDIEELVNFIP